MFTNLRGAVLSDVTRTRAAGVDAAAKVLELTDPPGWVESLIALALDAALVATSGFVGSMAKRAVTRAVTSLVADAATRDGMLVAVQDMAKAAFRGAAAPLPVPRQASPEAIRAAFLMSHKRALAHSQKLMRMDLTNALSLARARLAPSAYAAFLRAVADGLAEISCLPIDSHQRDATIDAWLNYLALAHRSTSKDDEDEQQSVYPLDALDPLGTTTGVMNVAVFWNGPSLDGLSVQSVTVPGLARAAHATLRERERIADYRLPKVVRVDLPTNHHARYLVGSNHFGIAREGGTIKLDWPANRPHGHRWLAEVGGGDVEVGARRVYHTVMTRAPR